MANGGNQIDIESAVRYLNNAINCIPEVNRAAEDIATQVMAINNQCIPQDNSSSLALAYQEFYDGLAKIQGTWNEKLSTSFSSIYNSILLANVENRYVPPMADIQASYSADLTVFCSQSSGIKSYSGLSAEISAMSGKIDTYTSCCDSVISYLKYVWIVASEGTNKELEDAAHGAAEDLRTADKSIQQALYQFKIRMSSYLDSILSKDQTVSSDMIDKVEAMQNALNGLDFTVLQVEDLPTI